MGEHKYHMAKRTVAMSKCAMCGSEMRMHNRGMYTVCSACSPKAWTAPRGRGRKYRSYIPKKLWKKMHPNGVIPKNSTRRKV